VPAAARRYAWHTRFEHHARLRMRHTGAAYRRHVDLWGRDVVSTSVDRLYSGKIRTDHQNWILRSISLRRSRRQHDELRFRARFLALPAAAARGTHGMHTCAKVRMAFN